MNGNGLLQATLQPEAGKFRVDVNTLRPLCIKQGGIEKLSQ